MAVFFLATEDILSEEVGRRLILELGEKFSVGPTFRQNGNGYLKQRLPNFCSIAERQPFLLITDLDQTVCPTYLISDWLGNRPKPPNLLFRVAVREIEAWLLADHDGIIDFLGARVTKLTEKPDALPDPKSEFLRQALRAPREIREDIVPEKNAITRIGLGYNRRLTDFVRNVWNPNRAAARSDSLRRARERLRAFAATV